MFSIVWNVLKKCLVGKNLVVQNWMVKPLGAEATPAISFLSFPHLCTSPPAPTGGCESFRKAKVAKSQLRTPKLMHSGFVKTKP